MAWNAGEFILFPTEAAKASGHVVPRNARGLSVRFLNA